MTLTLCPNPSIDTFLTLPLIMPGKVNRSTAEQRFPGGKGVHVALALAELGEKVNLLGFWGGASGEWIRKECINKGVSKCTLGMLYHQDVEMLIKINYPSRVLN